MSLRELHPELAEKAIKMKKEDPEKMENGLKEIKKWISEQPHLKARTDDQFLAAFLRGLKFDLEKVKTRLDLFYTCRSVAKEFYSLTHRDEKFWEIFETGYYLPLPKLSSPGAPRVVLIRPGLYKPERHKITDVFSVVHIIDKLLLIDDDNSIISGNISITDMKDVAMTVLIMLSPSQLKKLLACQQDSLPFCENKSIFLNVAMELEMFLVSATHNMLDDKSRNETTVYSENYKEMYKTVPREILPVEYGGTCGTLDDIIYYWKNKVEEYGEWLDEDLTYVTDETRRIGSPRTEEDMFGDEVPSLFSVFQQCID